MLTIEWLWVLLFLPLPWLYRYLLPVAKAAEESVLRVPFIDDFKNMAGGGRVIKKDHLLFWLGVLAWACLVAAASRPQWLGESIELPVSGRDIMLAVDLSGSMEMEDFVLRNNQRVDRLTATKAVAGEFIERRTGDRVGLILFGRQAYVQTPLTFDRETVKTLLYESAIGLAGKETAIGDAIGLAVKRFREMQSSRAPSPAGQSSKPILILLTDGANTAGEVEPVKAAEFAAQEGLKIYTIGIGADQMTVPSLFGARRINPSMDLDEETLTAIADKTGGKYFRARDTEELEKIYQLLDELEPIARESKSFRPKISLYYWPLSIAVLLAMAVLLLSGLRR
ncbi:MAG: VWA domain-containing protein [Gammaproteobacteria bacterium]|nr:VWA domain-containing protein [Gammaproteobacteria bacterium]